MGAGGAGGHAGAAIVCKCGEGAVRAVGAARAVGVVGAARAVGAGARVVVLGQQ